MIKNLNLLTSKILLVFVLLFFFINSSNVEGAMLGVNRVELFYDDVLRGGYSEKEFVVSIGTPNFVNVFVEARGDVADWISFEPSEMPIQVNENNPATITAIIQPPSDLSVGIYRGKVLVTTGALKDMDGEMGSTVEAAFELEVYLNITDTQLMRCYAAGMSITDTEIGYPLEFRGTITNNGNVRVRPYFQYKILDQNLEETVMEDSFYYDSEIFPTRTQNIKKDLELNLAPGQYWMEIEEPYCNSKQILTFSVLEKGGISDEGELVRIESDPWAETKQIVPVNIHFKNTGKRTVSAQFKGALIKNNQIIEVLESDEIDVEPDELTIMNLFFESEETGQYQVIGRVHYNRKVTFEKGTVINVNQGSEDNSKSNSTDYLLIFFIMLLIVMFLFIFLILRKKKQKKKHKF